MRCEYFRNIILNGLIPLCSIGCGARVKDLAISDKPNLLSQSVLIDRISKDQIFIANESAQTFEAFTLDPFTHLASISSPHRLVKPSVGGSNNGSYFVSLAGNDYAISQKTGNTLLNPIPIKGEIQSLAFDSSLHTLAITSSLQAVYLLSLNESGAVTGSLVIDNLIDSGKALGASTILNDGRLAIVGGGTQLVFVDIIASIRDQLAIKNSINIDNASSMGWIRVIPSSPNRLLILDGSRLIVVDTDTGTIVDSKSLNDTKIVGRYSAYDPHIITQNAGQEAQDIIELSFIGKDGKIATRTLLGSPYTLDSTSLDVESLNFAAFFVSPKPNKTFGTKDEQNMLKNEVYRYELTDASNQLRTNRNEVDSDAQVVLRPNYFFIRHDSVFGRSERRSYGDTPNSQNLEGYNLSLIRDRYRKL